MAEEIVKIKASELPNVDSMADGDIFVVVVGGISSGINFANLSNVFFSTAITPAQVRDKLASLTGTDRLDASAIKNLMGGGGGGFTELVFGEATNCSVVALGVDEGWDFSVEDGVGTLTVPEGGFPLCCCVKGVDGFAVYNEGVYTGAFKLRIVREDEGTLHDLDFASLLARKTYAITVPDPEDIGPGSPLVFDPGTVELSIDEIGSGVVGLVFNNLLTNMPGQWVVGF